MNLVTKDLIAKKESENCGNSRDGDSDAEDEVLLLLRLHLLHLLPLAVFALTLWWEDVILSLGRPCWRLRRGWGGGERGGS